VRCAFFDTWTRLHREAYWDQLNAWCREHSLLHVGHVGGEDNLPDHLAGGFGEFFRTAGTLDVPGVDAIWRQLWRVARDCTSRCWLAPPPTSSRRASPLAIGPARVWP